MSSPFLRADNKSVSSFENKQFFIFPSAVRRILLQVLQKGEVMVLMTAKVPLCPGTIYFFVVSFVSSFSLIQLYWVSIVPKISCHVNTLSSIHLLPVKGINSIKRICTGVCLVHSINSFISPSLMPFITTTFTFT